MDVNVEITEKNLGYKVYILELSLPNMGFSNSLNVYAQEKCLPVQNTFTVLHYVVVL